MARKLQQYSRHLVTSMPRTAGWEESGLVAAGIIRIVVGLVAIALAMALSKGSEVVRILYVIF